MPLRLDADQDHVGLGQVLRRLAVVVGQREVDRLDAVVVLLALRDVGEAADAVVRRHAELGLERLDEGVEHVEHQALRLRRFTIARISGLTSVMKTIGLRPSCSAVWLISRTHLVRLVGGVDEGPAHVARLDRELRQDRVAEGLGGDAGAVGDEEHGAVGARRRARGAAAARA